MQTPIGSGADELIKKQSAALSQEGQKKTAVAGNGSEANELARFQT
jgi:hypothetical protein